MEQKQKTTNETLHFLDKGHLVTSLLRRLSPRVVVGGRGIKWVVRGVITRREETGGEVTQIKDLPEVELLSCRRLHGASHDDFRHVVSHVTEGQPTDKCDEESEHDTTQPRLSVFVSVL